VSNSQLSYDGWLDKHFSNITGRKSVLELGCGRGDDTSFLAGTGHAIVSCDIDGIAVNHVKRSFPGVLTKKFDMRDGFPFAASSADIVVASLCLHFFTQDVTRGILSEIGRVLKRDGLLLCRLNSDKGFKQGMGPEPELAPGLYMTSGGMKQFYNEEMVRALFSGWNIIRVDEYRTVKYSKANVVLEIVMKPLSKASD
jgi:SAM-dependent methyltransferase